MNAAPSHLPRLAGAASLSKPDFDILLAVSSARQATLPTVRMLAACASREAQRVRVHALSHFLAGTAGATEQFASRPVRFFDLSDDGNALPETMNSLFTRGFQPMLSPSDPERASSDHPIPPDVETME